MKIISNKLNIPRIKTDKIKKIPWILASHAFLIILIFILLSLMLGIFLFYKYAISTKAQEQKIIEGTIKFQYDAYQEVLREWQKNEQKLRESSDKKYLNLFNIESENLNK